MGPYPNGPLSNLIELLDTDTGTQVPGSVQWVLLEISWNILTWRFKNKCNHIMYTAIFGRMCMYALYLWRNRNQAAICIHMPIPSFCCEWFYQNKKQIMWLGDLPRREKNQCTSLYIYVHSVDSYGNIPYNDPMKKEIPQNNLLNQGGGGW